MKILHVIAFILVIIGGLNWLWIGLLGGGGVGDFLGASLARAIYVLVGLSAVYLVVFHKKDCKMCGGSM
ncbi:hypothetical protein A2567_01265 [Candidatus Azambacteria bacterium RIFOXYD1_FULL_42_11]|uniref:DUF378 domain-containing protein n=3 Tax=Candidatus Azamiibacteriota TaxID=1752741 RepID=A0A0G0ZAT5_9BACT|nr:MAG: hypothetical protein UV07_C0014G0006 [Candidatus Azambacteria bacterium GW2011_GWB1_42_17]KKS45812.1 MAG: hypothetical protein UV10_C0013G0006 [Candidatus Azambacteria bacterium GW2011_GWA1_42_19]OGD42988.1 MAG: hypothetical protein A2567_01265 [Candidatus Azambacteria bacterium RIFOXYD1_FULL_42_11]